MATSVCGLKSRFRASSIATASATKAVHAKPKWGGASAGPASMTTGLVQNDETVVIKIASFEESFNKIRTFSSLDLMQSFSATAQGEIMGIGGSVTSTTEAKAHTELETETFNRTKKEMIIDDSVRRVLSLGLSGMMRGRSLVEEGESLAGGPARIHDPHRDSDCAVGEHGTHVSG